MSCISSQFWLTPHFSFPEAMGQLTFSITSDVFCRLSLVLLRRSRARFPRRLTQPTRYGNATGYLMAVLAHPVADISFSDAPASPPVVNSHNISIFRLLPSSPLSSQGMGSTVRVLAVLEVTVLAVAANAKLRARSRALSSVFIVLVVSFQEPQHIRSGSIIHSPLCSLPRLTCRSRRARSVLLVLHQISRCAAHRLLVNRVASSRLSLSRGTLSRTPPGFLFGSSLAINITLLRCRSSYRGLRSHPAAALHGLFRLLHARYCLWHIDCI